MSETSHTFDQARARLEEISREAKDASLEACLDLLEEGVELANVCTERIDHTRWREDVAEEATEEDASTGDVEGEQTPETSADEPAVGSGPGL